jgi:signal transduction histidine kinase
MLMMIKTYNPFKKEKITPSDPYLVIEKDHKSELHKDVIITPTHTAKSTPISSSHYIQEFIFPSSQNLQFFRNDIIPESKQSNSYHNNSYPSNFSSKFVESEIKKDDKDEIMMYIRCLFHDFRSPLNNISMGIDILDETILKNEETQEIINNMKESSKFITNALNGFLNIKNIISGNTNEFIQINNKNFNIIECIKKSEKLMLYKIKSKRLQIEYKLEIPENYQNVYGDASNLQHVFMNLLSNAVKFSENDTKITIIIMLNKENNKENNKEKNTVNNTEKIRFTYMVIDENKHIEPEIKRILFQKYNTSNTSTGTGLGLYICKNIIELYDGKIEHEYNNPIGNIFRVEFGLEVGKPTVSLLSLLFI